MTRAYYNENDPYAAQWLRNLVSAGLIAPGDVDERGIQDVEPSDLTGYTQCHFFAGLGGWSRALRLAGWADDRPVWTGSCPCQPFSTAGKGAGFTDERHLWPAFFHLISESSPSTVFGEQVAGTAGLTWFDLVQADLETKGYAAAPIVLPACGVGAPHLRQRTYWMAQSLGEGFVGQHPLLQQRGPDEDRAETTRGCPVGGMGNASSPGSGRKPGSVHPAEAKSPGEGREVGDLAHQLVASGATNGVAQGDSVHTGLQGDRCDRPSGFGVPANAGPVNGFWADAEWLTCTDSKARATKPGIFPLADGVPARVGKLRAAGNAIVPQVAAEVIEAAMEVLR